MIYIAAGACDKYWFGVAWAAVDLVATARGESKDAVLNDVKRCLPKGTAYYVEDEPPPFAANIISLLGDIEAGREDKKHFTLSAEYLSPPQRRILTVASVIPIGYVTTYGDIAKVAGSEARAVGRVMATNPLYPIVPCHRVVGSDMSLVGYGGKQDSPALAAKLGRIRSELRGAHDTTEIAVLDAALTVYPGERVIEAAEASIAKKQDEARRKAETERADRLQLKLF